MNKKQIIIDILNASKIHHNIYISWNKMPDYTEEDGLDWQDEAQFMLDDFTSNFRYKKINDKGNRNLCDCKKVICKKEDFITEHPSGFYCGDGIGWRTLEEAEKEGLINCKTNNFTIDGACKKHDLWHIYSYGRMGATLYWDKYWDESNTSGLFFKYTEEELEEKPVNELKTILKEIIYFNKLVKELMKGFYSQCDYRLKELREEKAREEKEEKEYQELKKQVIEKSVIKRLMTEIL